MVGDRRLCPSRSAAQGSVTGPWWASSSRARRQPRIERSVVAAARHGCRDDGRSLTLSAPRSHATGLGNVAAPSTLLRLVRSIDLERLCTTTPGSCRGASGGSAASARVGRGDRARGPRPLPPRPRRRSRAREAPLLPAGTAGRGRRDRGAARAVRGVARARRAIPHARLVTRAHPAPIRPRPPVARLRTRRAAGAETACLYTQRPW